MDSVSFQSPDNYRIIAVSRTHKLLISHLEQSPPDAPLSLSGNMEGGRRSAFPPYGLKTRSSLAVDLNTKHFEVGHKVI
jgi:hypothetical protein